MNSEATAPPETSEAPNLQGGYRRRYTRYLGDGRAVSLTAAGGAVYLGQLLDDSLGGACVLLPAAEGLASKLEVTVTGWSDERRAVVRNVSCDAGEYYVGLEWIRATGQLRPTEAEALSQLPALAEQWQFYFDNSAWPLLSHALRQYIYATVEWDFGDVRTLAKRLLELLNQKTPSAELAPLLAQLRAGVTAVASEASRKAN